MCQKVPLEMSEPELGQGTLIGEGVRFFGHVIIGSNVIIDRDVSIGYPRLDAGGLDDFDGQSLDGYLEMIAERNGHKTIIGNDSIIRSGTTIYQGAQIGSNLDCAHNCTIREQVTIGANAYLRVGCEIKPYARIGDDAVLSGLVGDRVIVGNDVTSHGQIIHSYTTGRRYEIEAAPVLSDGCFVGSGAAVIGGVTVGAGAQIAAGAIVTTDVPDGAQVRSEKSIIFEGESTLAQRN